MMRSTGIPFLLSTNTKNPEIPTLPRNFNRTELLTVFDRLVPYVPDEPEKDDTSLEDTTVNDILSDLEDEEEPFELTSDAIVTEAAKQNIEPLKEDEGNNPVDDFFNDDSLFEDAGRNVEFKPETGMTTPPYQNEEPAGESTEEQLETPKEEPEEEQLETPKEEPVKEPLENEPAPQESPAAEGSADNDPVKAAVKEWLDKNARTIIKEIVLEQLASLSGKNNG